jgi:hypothetical protein
MINYNMTQKKWIEDQEGTDELLRIALKDKVKYVKIPQKYTPGQLENARAACKESAIPPDSDKPHTQ